MSPRPDPEPTWQEMPPPIPVADSVALPVATVQQEEQVEYVEPKSDLPPCPQPYDELRKAMSKPDWAAVLNILHRVFDRIDCDPGRWRELRWAYGEVSEIIRLRRNANQPNPIEAVRSLQLAVLALFDNSGLLMEKTILIKDVSSADTVGYQRVEGTDSVTGDSITLLSPQSIAPGQEVLFWVIDQPEAFEPGLQRDMIRYVRLVNPALAHQMRRDKSTRDRLPEDMRNDSVDLNNTDPMTVSEAHRKARESTRLAAEKTSAMLEVAKPQLESAMQQGRVRLIKREKQVAEIIGGFLQFEFDIRAAEKKEPWQLAPIKP